MDRRPVKSGQRVCVAKGEDYRLAISNSAPSVINIERAEVEQGSWFGSEEDSPPRSSWFGYGRGTHKKHKDEEHKVAEAEKTVAVLKKDLAKRPVAKE